MGVGSVQHARRWQLSLLRQQHSRMTGELASCKPAGTAHAAGQLCGIRTGKRGGWQRSGSNCGHQLLAHQQLSATHLLASGRLPEVQTWQSGTTGTIARSTDPAPHGCCPSPPQLPQVDDRLAGEGTGKILGINDPSLFWAITIVFTIVWGVFYVSTRCAPRLCPALSCLCAAAKGCWLCAAPPQHGAHPAATLLRKKRGCLCACLQ